MTTAPANDTINLRLPSAKKALIDRAAESVNETRSGFMLEAAVARAETILADRTRFVLNDKQVERFQAALDAPLPDPKALIRLLTLRPPWAE